MTDSVWQEIQAEKEQTRRQFLVHHQALYDVCLQEILQATDQIPSPLPELGPTGKFRYTYYFDDDSSRRIYGRQSVANPSGQATVVVDVLMEDSNLVAMSLSVDESLVAYVLERIGENTTTTNYQKTQILVRHVESGVALEITLPNTTTGPGEISSVEFGPLQWDGSHSLFYVTNDSQGRPCRVWACTVRVNDLEENNPRLQHSTPFRIQDFHDHPAVMVHVQRTKACRHVQIQATTKSDNEIWLCHDVLEPLQVVMPRRDHLMYHLDVGANDEVFILLSDSSNIDKEDEADGGGTQQTNENNGDKDDSAAVGIEFSLWKTTMDSLPVRATTEEGTFHNLGTCVASERTGFVISDMDIFEGFVALYERSKTDGSQRLRILHQESSEEDIIPVHHPCEIMSPCGNMHYLATSIRFALESPACPPQAYEYHFVTKRTKRISHPQSPSPPLYPEDDMRQERVLVTSQDGTQVPMSLVYRTNMEDSKHQQDANAIKGRRVVLLGYGSYGEPMDLSFNPSLQPLLRRGFVLAFCHGRGGGDLGRNWYHRGRLYNKANALADYMACAQELVQSPLLHGNKIIAKAFSAGGVLVGAAVHQRPEWFEKVSLTNCFLDVKKTMENKDLFLTEHEYDEFGDPVNDPKAAEVIAALCPVTNARQSKEEQTASFLLIGAFDDQQVPYWNSVIYGNEIRKKSRVKDRVLIHIESHGGHHLQLHVAALEATFMIGNRAAYYGIELED